MGNPKVDNKTPYAFEALHLVDEEFSPLFVPLVKATFDIARDGQCAPAEAQIPANLAGTFWGEDAETSSYKYEPEVAFMKPATDVVVVGHAWAPKKDTTEMRVGVRVGALTKEALVSGDRVWFRTAGATSATRPLPFEKMPLTYERAYGGWDRTHPDERKHTCEPRNPVGTGYRGTFEEGIRLPNVEDPRTPVKSLGDHPVPTGFGFISPHWKPRAALAGTFDDAWTKQRAPLLPRDFDRRHLNSASPGLVARGYLRGDEPVVTLGMRPEGALSFTLPGVPTPQVRVELANGGPARDITLNLDTIILEPDDRRVILMWRGNLALPQGPHELRTIQIS